MRTYRGLLLASLVSFLPGLACSGESDDAPPDDGFETILSYTWEAPPGFDKYFCIRKTLTEDLWINGVETIAPLGSHHAVITWGEPDGVDGGPDGAAECLSDQHQFNAIIYYSSQQNSWQFPEGYGAHIPAGQQVLMNLHLLNAGDTTLSGTTEARVLRTTPDQVGTLATAISMGKVSLSIPPGESTQIGECEMLCDVEIIAVNPHMHSHGTHMRVVANSSVTGEQQLLDMDYDWNTDPYVRDIDPFVPMKRGDTVDVYCSYFNDTTENLPYGPSAWTDEMCWSINYVAYDPACMPTTGCGN